MTKLIVKCVGCGLKKEYMGKEQPICDKCFNLMVAVKATKRLKERNKK